MDSPSVANPGKRAKGSFFAWGLLAGGGIAAVAFGWLGNRPLPPDSPTVLNIRDGNRLMGQEILTAAAVLSNERVVRIEFSQHDKRRSIFAGRRSPDHGIEIDAMSIRITPWKIEINDEGVSLSVLRERLQAYGRAARLTDSRPILLLSCSEGVPGSKLIEVLQLLVDAGINWIGLPDPLGFFEPRPTPPAPPQIKPLAHPIELK